MKSRSRRRIDHHERPRRARQRALLALLTALAGCAEANPIHVGGGGSAAGGGGGAGQGGEASGASGGAGPRSAVVVNELSLEEDWVELYNQSEFATDVGGLVIADDDGDGAPRTSEALELPKGTSIAPHGYLFVLAKQGVDPGKGDPETDCAPGPSPCFYAAFGLAADGDAVHLLRDDTELDVLSSEGLAPDPAQSICRSPDGAGAVAACAPTPGAANP